MILVRHALGEVLRQHRTEQGRTLRDVADAARVSLGYLSEIERGQKEPSSELLYSVCDALKVPLSEVLAETGDHLRVSEVEQDRRTTVPRGVAGASRSDGARPTGVRSGTAGPSRAGTPRAALGHSEARRSTPVRPLLTRVILGRGVAATEPGSLGDLVTMPQSRTEVLRLESRAIVPVAVPEDGRELADALA